MKKWAMRSKGNQNLSPATDDGRNKPIGAGWVLGKKVLSLIEWGKICENTKRGKPKFNTT